MADGNTALLLQVSADVSRLEKQFAKAQGIVDGGSRNMEKRSQAAMDAISASFGTVTADKFKAMLAESATLQDKLTAAQVAGNSAEARALGQQLVLQRQVQKAAVLQLETQLAIAKATGNTNRVKQLQELLAVSQQLQRLSSVGLVGTKGLTEAERAVVSLTAAEKAAEKAGISLAATRVFDSAKLTTLEAGSARLRIFGSALEPLGPLGLAAAAGVAAFAIAMEQAHQAVEFADNLFKLAQQAHITSDELQQLQIALRDAGGNPQDVAPALAAFNVVLGKAEAGIPRALRAFRELFGNSFTAADAKQLAASGHAFDTVSASISGLKDVSQQDASVQQFGLEGLKLLIEKGPEGMKHLREEAQASGQVFDSELVKRGHELNDQIEALTGRIKVDLASAFIQLAPILIKLLGYLANMADAVERVVSAMSPLEGRPTNILQSERRGLVARQQGGGIDAAIHGPSDREHIARIDTELARRAAEPPPKPVTGTRDLADQTKHKAGPRDDTAEREETVAAALATAKRQELEAQKALTQNAIHRGVLEIQALEEEGKAQIARLEKQKAEIDDDKGIKDPATKKLLKGRLDEAEAAVNLAILEKQELAEREAGRANDDHLLAEQREIAGYLDQVAGAGAQQATTAKARTEIEHKTLLAQQKLLRQIEVETLRRQVEDNRISQSGADAILTSFDQAQVAERSNFDIAHEGPVKKYLRSIEDLNSEFENASVTAVKNLSDGLADAIVNAKSLGDVASSVFRQLIAQLLSAAIQRDIAGPLLHLIPGFASGTDYAPGGLAIVGEHGPELLNLPRGSQVTPHGRTIEALRSIAPPQASGGTVAINQYLFPDFRGAVVTQDLVESMQAYSRAAASHAAAGAMTAARKGWPAQQQSFGLLGTT